jgi:hypothetical protein
VLEQFHYEAHFSSNGYSGEYAPAFSNKLHPCSVLTKKCNDVVMLLKRFFDGAKIDLGGVFNLNKGLTIV